MTHHYYEDDQRESPWRPALRNSTASDTKKAAALMQVLERIVTRHGHGQVFLDNPSFQLYELAKRFKQARTEGEFHDALRDLENFKK